MSCATWKPYRALFMRRCLDNFPRNSLPKIVFEKAYAVNRVLCVRKSRNTPGATELNTTGERLNVVY